MPTSRPSRAAFLIAALVTVHAAAPLTAQPITCAAVSPKGAMLAAAWTRWGIDVGNTRSVAASQTAFSRENVRTLRFAWAISLGASVNARSQPAVAGSTIFAASETGAVMAIDSRTGCVRWTFQNEVPVRTGLVTGVTGTGDSTLWYGDVAGTVHAIDVRTGTRRWKQRVDAHQTAMVTGTPQFHRGALYVPVSSYETVMPLSPEYACCGFRGSVVALDAASGKVRWQSFTIADTAAVTGKTASGVATRGPSGAAVWSTPTIDERLGRLYIGTGNNYSRPATTTSDAIIAMDLATGRVAWSRQFTADDTYNSSCDAPMHPNCANAQAPDADFGQPPILQSLPNGKRVLVAAQKSGEAHALDPDRNGALLWTTRVASGGKLGGAHWGSAADGRLLYVPIGGQEILPVRDTSVKEGYRLDAEPTKGGGLAALDLQTGTVQWRSSPPSCASRTRCSPAQSAPVTAVGGLLFSGALDGVIRAYNSANGEVLWEFDTVREFQTRNGKTAHGGAIDVAGPVVAGRMLYVMSGYALFGGRPGNVLLAFELP